MAKVEAAGIGIVALSGRGSGLEGSRATRHTPETSD